MREPAVASYRGADGAPHELVVRATAEGGWRVAIVDGAEDLNQNSENALLKILEEPPSRETKLISAWEALLAKILAEPPRNAST